jgi:flagellar biosynthesis protein FlhF
MKIKRYTAANMRKALDQVRAEQGPDAVIMSSRRIGEGIEVIAAVDYDEALIAESGRQRPAAAFATSPEPQLAPTPPSDSGYQAMQRELADLRRMLEGQLAGLSWNDRRFRDPVKTRTIEEFSAMGLAPDVVRELTVREAEAVTAADPSHLPLTLLVKRLPVAKDMTYLGGIVAVVGPTGAGKTTSIAKMAAQWSLRHGSQDLALVSIDGYRVGAREQLTSYARILGAPVYSANSGAELLGVLDGLKDKKLVLIDTAGMAPRDIRLPDQLSALQQGASRARVLLALPAQGEVHALEQIVRAFADLAPVASIITKVDEAASLGPALTMTLRHKLPIAYLCDGQRVPEDLHLASAKSVWLIRTAIELAENADSPSDDYFPRHFGKEYAHA